MKTWTPYETQILIENYAIKTNEQLMKLIPQKSWIGIYKKARKLNLHRNPEVEFKNRSIANSGEHAANWKGGVRTTKHGYRQILSPGHPRSDSSGYVMEHIAVWEKETGIPVPIGCVIHHLNGNKQDNRIENLCMMQFGAHTKFHHTGLKRSEETIRRIKEAKKK